MFAIDLMKELVKVDLTCYISQEHDIFFIVNIDNRQFSVVSQHFQDIFVCETSLIVPGTVHCAQSFVYLYGIHRLHISSLKYATNISNDITEYVLLSISSFSSSTSWAFRVTVNLFKSLETVIHELNGVVNVILIDLFPEMEFSHRLRNSYDCQECPRCNIHIAHFILTFSLELSLFHVTCDDILVKLTWNRWSESLSLGNERSHNLLFDSCLRWSDKSLMYLSNMSCQSLIQIAVGLVQEQEDDVKSGKESC